MLSLQEELRAEQVRSRRREQLLEGENEVLKLIIEREPLPSVLDALTRLAERQSVTGLLASILLLDRDRVHLRHGAAPSLPAAYSSAIDGISIGPSVGSCGTAAYTGKPVIVTDISSDPLWADFSDLAAQHALRACWSYPILSSRRQVLGTFALYYREPRVPDADDEAIISILTRTAALAIEHHNAELSLSESEERFRSLTRSAPLGVFMTNAEGAFSYVNPRFVELSGFDYEKTFDYWLEQVGEAEIVDDWRAAMNARLEYVREFSIRRDGLQRFVGLRAGPMRSATGEYLGYVGTLEDVSPRVLADAELRRESNLRKAIEESIPAGIAAISTDGTQTYVNRAFSQMVGWTAEELVGRKPPFVYWPKDQIAAIQNAFSETLHRAGSPNGYELRFQRKNGEQFEALVTVAPLQGESAEASGWVASVLDRSLQTRA